MIIQPNMLTIFEEILPRLKPIAEKIALGKESKDFKALKGLKEALKSLVKSCAALKAHCIYLQKHYRCLNQSSI